MSIVLITHYQRILRFVVPDYVHVMYQGKGCPAIAGRDRGFGPEFRCLG